MRHHLNGQGPIVIEVIIKGGGHLFDYWAPGKKFEIAKVGLIVQTEILVKLLTSIYHES